LELARRDARVVITADLDYPRLLALTQSAGPGVVLFQGGDYSEQEARQRLQALFNAVPPEDLPNSLVVIEKARIRRRHLPI
jgi:predicted nuclease of predicted toxin-antitoxin system